MGCTSFKLLQKIPVSNFEWIKYTLQFNEDFIKSYKEESDKDIFSKYSEKVLELYNNLLFLL